MRLQASGVHILIPGREAHGPSAVAWVPSKYNRGTAWLEAMPDDRLSQLMVSEQAEERVLVLAHSPLPVVRWSAARDLSPRT